MVDHVRSDEWKANNKNRAPTLPKKNQLIDLVKAMGEPKFNIFSGTVANEKCLDDVGVVNDNVDKFMPLLLAYLNVEGNNVDDTASFQDLFGKDNGLEGWTLLTAAASTWVNAPKCMKLLLKHGADPLHMDSSGRTVLAEALATTRHGQLETWKVLEDYLNESPSYSREEVEKYVRAARLADITEALIFKLREGTSDVHPFQRRHQFASLWEDGFQLYQKRYSKESLSEFFSEMELISLETLKERRSIPRYTKGSSTIQHVLDVMIRCDQDGNTHKVIFVSHRWLSRDHPDNTDGNKLASIIEAVQTHCKHENLPPSQCFLWIDYACMNQETTTSSLSSSTNYHPDFVRGMQSLPMYILLSDAFLFIRHDEYMTRAWCKLELLLGASIPIKTRSFSMMEYDPNIDKLTTNDPHAMDRKLSEYLSLRPETGGVTNPDDMAYIKALTWFAENLHKWFWAMPPRDNAPRNDLLRIDQVVDEDKEASCHFHSRQ